MNRPVAQGELPGLHLPGKQLANPPSQSQRVRCLLVRCVQHQKLRLRPPRHCKFQQPLHQLDRQGVIGRTMGKAQFFGADVQILQRARRLQQRLSHQPTAGKICRQQQRLGSLLGVELACTVNQQRAAGALHRIRRLAQQHQQAADFWVNACLVHSNGKSTRRCRRSGSAPPAIS